MFFVNALKISRSQQSQYNIDSLQLCSFGQAPVSATKISNITASFLSVSLNYVFRGEWLRMVGRTEKTFQLINASVDCCEIHNWPGLALSIFRI